MESLLLKYKVVPNKTTNRYDILMYPLRPVWEEPLEQEEWTIVQSYQDRPMATHACHCLNEHLQKSR